jgi:peptidyl-prolyl cis-trans isomerase D
MFDLFRSREKSVRIILGALLLLVGLSMLTYLVPSYNTGSGASDVVVAQIGKDEITLPEVQRLIQSSLRGRQMPPEMLPNFIPTFIDQLVTERALAYQADRLGFKITDQDLANAIRMALPGLFQDGKFVGREAYAATLAQGNFTIEDYEAEMRRQVLLTRMRDVALEGVLVTPQEVEDVYRKRNEKVKVEFVKLTADKYKGEVQISPEDMQAYFKANSQRYMVQEKRNLVVLLADQAKIEQSLNPPDTDLQRMYTQNRDQFRTGDTVDLRHILLKTEGKPPADDAKIRAQAQDLLKQIKGGANFAELAKKYSEDPGSAAKGGEYDGVTHGQMVPEFDRAAFALKPGEISDVVKTQYGYHIIQVIRKQEARLKPFEEVKGELAAQWKKEHANDIMQQISDKVQTALQKDPANPEKVAAQFNMQVLRFNGISAGSSLPEIGASPDFDQAIAGLKKGEVSQAVAVAGNKVVVAEVVDITPARASTFEEVQGQIRDALTQGRATVAVQKHAQELLDKAKSMGGDLAKAAKSMGLEVKTSDEVARSGSITDLGSATYVQDAFSRPEGTVLGPIGLPDGTAVVKVVQHVAPDMSKLPEQAASLRQELKGQKGRDRNTLFEAGVKDALTKEGKLKIHQDVINRLIASYRS